MSMQGLVESLSGLARTLAPLVIGPSGAEIVAAADNLVKSVGAIRETLAEQSSVEDLDRDIDALRLAVNAHARATLASLEG